MERTIKNRLILIILGATLFNFIFWNEGYGVNVLIFCVFVILAACTLGLKLKGNPILIFVTIAMLLCSFAIVYHGSLFAIFMFYISIFLFIGFVHAGELKSIGYLVAGSTLASIKSLLAFYQQIPVLNSYNPKIRKIFKFIKLSLIPLVILFIFYIIYINANPEFDKLSFKVFDFIGRKLELFFRLISFERILFFLLGLLINIWILFKTDLGNLVLKEAGKKENLIRQRIAKSLSSIDYFNKLKEKAPEFYRRKFALSLKLKNEFISALVLLILVNILLFIVNIIDIKWVWFGFQYSEKFNLKQFVHEGTYLLIISILLSIGIMLYFFRKNLNFYYKSNIIKILAYIWIAQNFILTVSVAIRNFRYITYCGIAYRRIGVIIFLVAVAYGLISLLIKIRYNKSSFYLIKRNSFFVYALLVFSGMINWDQIIATHNLNHPIPNHIETSYLLSLSDKVLPEIDRKQYVLNQDVILNTYADFYPYNYNSYYQMRVKRFIKKYDKINWLSVNYKDLSAYRYFKNKTIK